MKKIITAFIFYFLCGECFSQAGEWVWIHGSNSISTQGNYGVQGIPSPANNPPAEYEPCEWTDLNGNFWLFGGESVIGGSAVGYADLWKYDPLINQWTWMKGPGTPNYLGNYGVQGVSSPSNNPRARDFAPASWVDNQGDLWMFGGFFGGCFNDLWKYDIGTNEWTWMKGDSTGNSPGIFGIQGIPSPAITPPGLTEVPSAWTDNSGALWLFGGRGINHYNALWRYNISTNEWTWIKGDSSVNSLGVYGTVGVEDSANKPRAMGIHSRWKDNYGMLWMYGGAHFSGIISYGDFWRFNPLTNNWTFMGANSTKVNGTKCMVSSLNSPGRRFESRAAWKDQHGDFLLFGGYNSTVDRFNDLWKYCIAANQWVWINGSAMINVNGNWGTMGVSSPTNNPGGRGGSVGWSDQNDQLYLFGGYGYAGIYGDLWKYTIDTTCGVCPPGTAIDENNPPEADELLVFPNPTNSSLTISFQSSSNQTIELLLYNLLGKQIYFSKEEITKGKFEKEINVEKYSDGIYFLQVKTKERNINRKVIVSHP